MPEINTVRSIISTLVKTKPVDLKCINTADLRYLKEDVCEFSGTKKTIGSLSPQKIAERVLKNKFKNEKSIDYNGRRQRFPDTAVNGLIELCKRDKELVLYLVAQKAPHGLKGYPDYGRFCYDNIKELVDLSAVNKPFLIELVSAKTANNRPAHSVNHIVNLMEFSKMEPETAKKLADIIFPENIVSNMINLHNTNPKNYKKIMETGVFDLIKEGKISPKVLDNVGENQFLSPRILDDIKKIKENKSPVKALAGDIDINNISKYVKDGEVFEHKSIVYVNDNGTPLKLSMTKEKFEELFPLVDSSGIQQSCIGDCWLVSFLDSLMEKPKGRAIVYNSIRQDGKDIIVQFKDSKKSIRFKNGELHPDKDQTLKGAKGLQFIEQAFAIHRGNNYTKGALETDALKVLSSNKDILSELDDGKIGEAYDAIVADRLTFKIFLKELYAFAKDSFLRRDNPLKLIDRYANDKNYLLQFYTKEAEFSGRAESCLNRKYNLYSEHAYTIKGYDKTKDTVYISNPWNTEIVTEVPVEKLLEYAYRIIPFKLK